MSRYIDADALIEELQHCSYETWSKDINRAWWAQAVKVKDNIVKCIERQPTADVVEVVRCKDCAHYHEVEGFEYKGRKAHHCVWHSALRGENDYCSDGIRSEK
jgi:hypothetical protein